MRSANRTRKYGDNGSERVMHARCRKFLHGFYVRPNKNFGNCQVILFNFLEKNLQNDIMK